MKLQLHGFLFLFLKVTVLHTRSVWAGQHVLSGNVLVWEEDGGQLGQWLWPDDLAPSLAGSFAGLRMFLILPVLGGSV